MSSQSVISRSLAIGVSCLALAACGADDIASPGTGGNVTITPTPPPPPPPPPPPTTATPAAACPAIADPQGLADGGTITGPTGTYRVCALPARVNVTTTLARTPGVLYRLNGRVDVGTDQGPTEDAGDAADVTLNIDPGVVIYANVGTAWLHVNRGNRINAVGTATAPIVFTSRENVVGTVDDNTIGQWGGVVLSGRAPVTDCTVAPAATPGTIDCERNVEGAIDPARYGGATQNDNSGRMSYVQIRYSGFILSGANELQALTTGGTGSGTILDHIQAHNSSDDAAEFFGGLVNMKYFVATGADDDNLDTDVGVKANIQYIIVVQRQGAGDSMIEADSDNANDGNLPRQNTRISNFTFIQRNNTSNLTAILLRGGTDYTAVNGVIVSPNTTCLAISRAQTASATVDAAIDEVGAPVFRSVVAQCGGTTFSGRNGVTDAQVSAIFGSGTNNNSSTFTPSLISTFVNGPNETAVTPFNASTINAFFDNTPYIGAVRNAADTWYQGWTCNSATANFGAGTNCTALPII